MKRWLVHFSITSREQILAEIDATLRKAGVVESRTTGVQILADRFRRADAAALSATRRVRELEESINEYERVFRAMQEGAAEPLVVEDQATPIEAAARAHSGVDLPMTQRTPVYRLDGRTAPTDERAREMPVLPSAVEVAETRRERVYGHTSKPE